MVENFTSGGAAINQLCKSFGLGLKVFELALEHPTRDFTQEPAMTEAEAAATLAYGMEAINGGVDLLAPGEMGIGNTTSAAAIYAALYGGPASRWTGQGRRRRRGARAQECGDRRRACAARTASLRPAREDNSEKARRTGDSRPHGRDPRCKTRQGSGCARRLCRLRGRRAAACDERGCDRSLPRRPSLRRRRACRGFGAAWQEAFARSRHAAGRGLGRRARGGRDQSGGRVSPRHGDFCERRSSGQG